MKEMGFSMFNHCWLFVGIVFSQDVLRIGLQAPITGSFAIEGARWLNNGWSWLQKLSMNKEVSVAVG